jgi:lambda repressor-like predicted transcriptional regulator
MQDAADVRAIVAALALAGRTQAWLATQLGLPRSTLRAGLYRQRALSAEKLAAIWCVLEAAGVRQLPPRRGQGGVGVRLIADADGDADAAAAA